MPRRKSPRKGPSSSLFPVVVLIVLTLALYARVRGHEFVNFDDDKYITENMFVRQGLSWEGVKWAFTTSHESNWHPLTWLSHMVDGGLFGLNPTGHHMVNVLLHASNAALLFWLLVRMTGARGASFVVAALFALHPLRVESVAWAAERKDVLSGLFWMLALLAYVSYARKPSVGKYLGVFSLLGLGLLAKPMLVTLPFVLLLLDLWPLRRWAPAALQSSPGQPRRAGKAATLETWPLGRLVLEKLPLLGLSVASSAVTMIIQHGGGATRPLEMVPMASRVTNALVSYVAYLWKAVLPFGLAVLYPHPALVSPRESSSIVPALGAGALLVVITVVVTRHASRRPYLAVGWLWYIGTLIPVIGVVQVGIQSMADRYTYLPLIGIYILVVWGVKDLAARWPGGALVVRVAVPVVLAALTTLSWFQIGHWRDSRTMWERALAVTTNNFMAHNNLGIVLKNQGLLADAKIHLERCIAIRPTFAKAHSNLGNVLRRLGDSDGAMAHFERAVQLDPEDAAAHNNLGNALLTSGDFTRAAAHYQRASELLPYFAEPLHNLGVVFQNQGRLDQAVAYFERALRVDPAYVESIKNLAHALVGLGRLAEARSNYEKALRHAPDDPLVHNNLGVVYERLGEIDRAAVHFEQAVRLDPTYAKARTNLTALKEKLARRQGRP